MDQVEGFPRYDSYRDSGIDWIGDIPGHWNAERAKWLFKKEERPVRSEDDIVTAFRDGTVTLRSNRRTEGFTNAIQEHGYQGIRKGDLVIHAMDAFAGAIGVSDSDGKSTPVYAACVNRGEYYTNNNYYAYLLRYMSKAGYIEALAKGIRERSTDFRFNDFSKLVLPVPPQPEQDRIADFLDKRTAQIDEAIAKKQRLIELLREQKVILINQAVTKGLNPDAPTRDSGVDWVGKVPNNWEVKKLPWVIFYQEGPGIMAIDFQEKGVPLLRISSLKSDIVSLNGCNFLSERKAQSKWAHFRLDNGDLLISGSASTGMISVVDNDTVGAIAYTGIFRIRPRIIGLLRDFLKLYFVSDSFMTQVEVLKTGVGMQHFGPSHLSRVYIAYPSTDEQLAIADYVRREWKKRDDVITIEQRAILALLELKQTLISEAVIGKIKVSSSIMNSG